jgi:hypothetical protein
MHMAKLGAIKENRPWTVQFNPTGYQVRNGAGRPVKTVTFGTGPYEDIKYANPTSTTQYDVDILTFNHNGLSNTGYAYLSNKRNSGYYRIGLPYSTGFLKTEKWTGSTWN